MQSAVQTAQKWIIASPTAASLNIWRFSFSFFRNILIFCKREFETLEEVCKVIITCYGSLNKTACLIFFMNVGDNHVNLNRTGQDSLESSPSPNHPKI